VPKRSTLLERRVDSRCVTHAAQRSAITLFYRRLNGGCIMFTTETGANDSFYAFFIRSDVHTRVSLRLIQLESLWADFD
jgi:hypothetical protein